MNSLDIAIIAVIALSALFSVLRGFVREAISLVIWIVAGAIAFTFTPHLEPRLVSYIEIDQLRVAASFVILFLASMVIGGIVSFLLGHIIKKGGLSGTDRMIGLVFGAARGGVIICILVWLGQYTPFSGDDIWVDSQLIGEFEKLVQILKTFLPDKLNNIA